MSEERLVNFVDIHEPVVLESGYRIRVTAGNHFTVVASVTYPSAAIDWDHPNIAAKQDRVLYKKAYWPSGRKKWFSQPGRDFMFVIPRNKIELVCSPGYSYVPVLINGHRYTLNVSGGSGEGGWTDYVGSVVHVGIGRAIQHLKQLADAAMSLSTPGLAELTIKELDSGEQAEFRRLVAAQAVRRFLRPGGKLMLAHCNVLGSRGPFEVTDKLPHGGGYIINTLVYSARVKHSQVDVIKTAEVGGFPYISPTQENRLGPVLAADKESP